MNEISKDLAMEDWVYESGYARCVIDNLGCVLHCNTEAHEIFYSSPAIHMLDGSIHFPTSKAQHAFEAMLADLKDACACLIIKLPSLPSTVELHAWRIAHPSNAHARIEIRLTDAMRQLTYMDIESIFSLTPAEHRTAIALLNGMSAAEVSTKYSVSLETVRTQIKSIYAKTGVRHRDAFHSLMRHYLCH